jgi:phage terminase large subunit-like protein
MAFWPPRLDAVGAKTRQGKSTLLSGIGLYMLIADGEPSAECFGAANSRDQASIVYKQMKELVQASPYLSSMLEIVDSRKTIACVPTNSFWRVISSDAGRQEGLNIHSLCYDEIHQSRDRALWDAVRYGSISRSQGLVLAITTAGVDRDSIGYELHTQAVKVMEDPTYDHQFFGYVRAASPDDDYRSPSVWKAANPSFGVTMDEETFKADVMEAERSGGSKLAGFLRYRLNLWVHGENKFVNLTQWEKCRGRSGHLDKSRVWYCGLDLAQTWDVNAFCAVSRASDDVYDCLWRFWIPADNASQRREEVPYVIWAKDPENGLVMTPGDTCDYEFIKRDILEFAKERQVARVFCDPHNAHYLTQQLQAEGLVVLGCSQSYASLNSSTKLLETLIAQGRLRTQDNPIVNWMASNAVTKTNAEGYIKIVKPSSTSPNRVDGMVALVMALAAASDAEAAAKSPDPEIIVI